MKFKAGFTLIELLVVIAIIGILASIVAPNIIDAIARARNASRMAALSTLETALVQYKEDNGQFPYAWPTYHGVGIIYGSYGYEGANGYIPNLTPKYIRRLPADPMIGRYNPAVFWNNQGYLYLSDGANFKLLSFCAPENPGSHYSDPSFQFYDPTRPLSAWATYSSGARDW